MAASRTETVVSIDSAAQGLLKVAPAGLSGGFDPPGDKSVTHRAYLLALMARGESVVRNPNSGADAGATLACARSLGLEILASGGESRFRGRALALAEPDCVLDCGNSGTTLRLLAGVLAGQDVFAVLAGDASLHRRPVRRVIEPLRRMGARFEARDADRLPPLMVHGGRLTAIDETLAVASAQVATAILFAALQAEGRTSVTLPGPARDHTERMLARLGAPIEVEEHPGGGRRVTLAGPWTPPGAEFTVPGDFSAAAFFFAAAAIAPGARVTAHGVDANPTRTGFLDLLERMGAPVLRAHRREQDGEMVEDVTVIGPASLKAIDVAGDLVPRAIDEVPAWAVVAAFARGRSRLTGAEELRVKESDRLAAMARNLAALGIETFESPDGLEIEGGLPRGGTVDAGHDHRVAMAFAVLGSRAAGEVSIARAAEIATSYPAFAATFAGLGGTISRVAEGGA